MEQKGTNAQARLGPSKAWVCGVYSDSPADEGYGAEARWNVTALGLSAGHAYRLESWSTTATTTNPVAMPANPA